VHCMLRIQPDLPDIWIQLQGVWEMIECTPSASMRQCTQQKYKVIHYETKVSDKCPMLADGVRSVISQTPCGCIQMSGSPSNNPKLSLTFREQAEGVQVCGARKRRFCELAGN